VLHLIGYHCLIKLLTNRFVDLPLGQLLFLVDLGDSCVRVELEELLLVAEGILLSRNPHAALSDWSDDRLDLVRVDDTGDVRVGHDRSREQELLLGRRLAFAGSVDPVELRDRALRPDHEAPNVCVTGFSRGI
jgi:hypothetical protein